MFRLFLSSFLFFYSVTFAIAGEDSRSIDDSRQELIKAYAAGGWSFVGYEKLSVEKFHTIIHRARTARFDPTRRVTIAFCVFDLEQSGDKQGIEVFLEDDEAGGQPTIEAESCQHHSRILDSSVAIKLRDNGKQLVFFKNLGVVDGR